jgi:TonB family protein
MMALIFDSALRSFALAALVWVVVVLTRVRNLHLEKSIWASVLGALILMPFLLHWQLSSRLALPGMAAWPLHSISLDEISIRATRLAAWPDIWSRALTGVYGFVAAVLLLRFAIGFCRAWRMSRAASRIQADWARGLDVRVCARLVAPVTFASTLLVPPDYERWSETKRRAVVAHEGAHIRSLDCYLQWIAAVYLCFFWFSPLSWWLRSRLATLAEHASDDAVLTELADARADYADILLEAARTRAGIVSMAVTVTSMAGGNMTRRIDRILSGGAPYSAPRIWQRLLVIGLLLPTAAFTAADTHVADGAATPNEHPAPSRDWPPSPGSKPALNADGAYIVAGAPNGLEPWYPLEAKRKGIEGMVRIAVTLDTAGRATDTQLLSEFPDGAGFGAAASAMAHQMTYANPSGHPTTLVFMVKFELAQGENHTPAQSTTTNFETGGESATPSQ